MGVLGALRRVAGFGGGRERPVGDEAGTPEQTLAEPLFPLTTRPEPLRGIPAVPQGAEEVQAPSQASPRRPRPTIVVKPLGNLANRMIQHMTAMSIASHLDGARISRIHLPEWGMEEPDLPDAPPVSIRLDHMRIDIAQAAEALRSDPAKSIAITGYAQNMRNFLPVDTYRKTFHSDIEVEAYGTDVLLINIRTNEILTADFPPYVLVPIEYYRKLVVETGLRPVFFGQLSKCLYIDDLRAAFPDAVFRHGAGVIHDFEVIRRSRNICISVSTFSWLAAWLSHADRIFMPLTGLFNPVYGTEYAGGLDLVPAEDPRYIFHLFPVNDAVKQDAYREAHAALSAWCRPVSGTWVRNMLARRPVEPRNLDDYLSVFDEEYYLQNNYGLADAAARGVIKSGLDHYRHHGFGENRKPFAIDRHYMFRYPDASMAVAEGLYRDFHHFHAAVGRLKGYRNVAEA